VKAVWAWWGKALALGPNINLDVDSAKERAAYEAVQEALRLAPRAPEYERAYVQALAKRYSIDLKADLKKLAVEYKDAMGELVKRYPDDLDLATLYAESMMDLRPWQLWTLDGKPAEGTEEIIAVLESVLRRNPNHLGANHYYIHTVEASRTPERALASANRLNTLAPAAGHLVHMPAHIYHRTGDHEEAARANERAIKADDDYFKTSGKEGIYYPMYYNHNIHFLAFASSMQGRYGDAMRAAKRLEENVAPMVKDMPMIEGFMPTALEIRVHFRKWDEILNTPALGQGFPVTTAFWHYARGIAYAATGKLAEAEREQLEFVRAKQALPADLPYGLNMASNVLKVAEAVLNARVALAKGDTNTTIDQFKRGVEAEDTLRYDEPPGWLSPVRESLGGVLILARRYEEAEKVFRADLERNRRNGRSLFGLHQSLKAQGKDYAAQMVKKEFDEVWKRADTKLRVEDL